MRSNLIRPTRWTPARVATAIRIEHGHAALGAFYDALWTESDGTERE
ncbi:hypothetical protein [Actinopolymorpha alba]|nr:hypothetical protein [Actinopolymorpha alba]